VYDATLSKISVKNIKDFIKHTYSLKINKNNHKCIYIEQVFIEVKR
ncbi:protein vraC, partial [Staphylococcus capitis]